MGLYYFEERYSWLDKYIPDVYPLESNADTYVLF